MKLIKTSNSYQLSVTREDWINLGRQQGWLTKEAHYDEVWWGEQENLKLETNSAYASLQEVEAKLKLSPQDPNLLQQKAQLEKRYQDAMSAFFHHRSTQPKDEWQFKGLNGMMGA